MSDKYQRPLTAQEAARMLGIHKLTLIAGIHDGKIRAHRTPGGHFRIPVAEVERILGGPLDGTYVVTPQGLRLKDGE